MAASPLTLASHSGVAPSRLAALTLAPARISSVDQFLVVAIDRPVQRRRAIGLRRVDVGLAAPAASRTAAVSPRIAASATSDSRRQTARQHQRRDARFRHASQ